MLRWLQRHTSLYLASCALGHAVSVAAQSDTVPFSEASAAFERGDYSRALALFEAARASGAEEPAVSFNIGVCRYKLGDFEQAAADFDDLAHRFPAMRGVAEYNRGLALVGLGRSEVAREAFLDAATYGDEQVAGLAAEQLSGLGATAPSRAPASAWYGSFDFGVGHDDNVALVDEVTLPVGEAADSPLAEFFGFASRSLGSRARARLDFTGYAVRYSDVPQFDEDSLRVAAVLERVTGDWRLEFGPRYEYSTLGDDAFEAEAGVAVRAERSLQSGWRFGAQIAYDDVESLEARYDYLEGAQRQVRVTLVRRASGSRLAAGLDFEDNDRAEPSVSSTRRRLFMNYRRGLRDDWSVEGFASYRLSQYDRTTGTDERLSEVGAIARRELARDWLLSATYRYSNNDADLPEFTYSADRVAVSIGKSF
jgi:tetratricopeptide (TPR) repeat protein